MFVSTRGECVCMCESNPLFVQLFLLIEPGLVNFILSHIYWVIRWLWGPIDGDGNAFCCCFSLHFLFVGIFLCYVAAANHGNMPNFEYDRNLYSKKTTWTFAPENNSEWKTLPDIGSPVERRKLMCLDINIHFFVQTTFFLGRLAIRSLINLFRVGGREWR